MPHLAANSDVPPGVENLNIDLKDTYPTTYELLQSMKKYMAKIYHFASCSVIFSDLGTIKIYLKIGTEAQASAPEEIINE